MGDEILHSVNSNSNKNRRHKFSYGRERIAVSGMGRNVGQTLTRDEEEALRRWSERS